jgi:NAD(P)-dependent dehydrogenase (short-subunit alcohol dehydrogenase family)
MGLMDRGDHSAPDTSIETWRRVLDANLTGVFIACKHGIRHLRDTDPAGGSVINAASLRTRQVHGIWAASPSMSGPQTAKTSQGT